MIIGISGVAAAGKDTLADMLVERGKYVKVALADPIKRMVRDAFAFSWTQLWGPSAGRDAPDERYPRERHVWSHGVCACCGARCPVDVAPTDFDQQCYLTPRYALQTLGTEWGRHAYQNVWVDYLIRTAEKLSKEGGYNYSSSSQDGLSHDWRPGDDNWHYDVVVPDVRFQNEIDALRKAGAYLIRIVRPGAGIGGAHTSETEQTKIPNGAFDMVVDNSGTLEDLKICAAQIVEGLALPRGS